MKNHAALVVTNQKGEILFCKRSMQKKILPGAWSFPSGTQENGEAILKTATREAREELGIEIIPTEIFATAELPEFSSRLHFVNCVTLMGAPKICDETEISELRWMTFKEFFKKFKDEEIGHGLVWLRVHPEAWETKFK